MSRLEKITAAALAALVPPPRRRLSEWIEREIRLPEGTSAQPGRVTLWPFQREIADAIGDPTIERVTMVKPVRVGFTTLLTSAIGGFVANDPSPILALQPTTDDCRDYMVSDLEPIFEASPALAGAMGEDAPEGQRNTMLSRRFAGGSLKIVAARAPRNLRRHNVKVLMIDEADAMEATTEGSPIVLAERRTLSFPDRKIILGSTPVYADTSHVLRAYAASDRRVFEVPCLRCGGFSEIKWADIVWDPDQPETARYRCPLCKEETEERHKLAMVEAGEWRATRPEVRGHAGFRLNALIAPHENAAWSKLVEEFLRAKDTPEELQTFVNTILGEGWRGAGEEISDEGLAARAVNMGLEAIPADVLLITAGVDVQHDRLEVTFAGWTESGRVDVLGHSVIWGAWDAEDTWHGLDAELRETWPHPLGGTIGISAVAVDASDGLTTDQVQGFCRGRARRKVMAIKGADGNRPMIAAPSERMRKARKALWIVGVDTIKEVIFSRAEDGRGLRFSETLPAVWYEQLTGERRIVRYSRGQAKRSFEPIPGRRSEALDCLVYAWAARQTVTANWDVLKDRAQGVAQQPSTSGPSRRPAERKGSDWLPKSEGWL